jgi:hypothetical protein
MKESRINQKDSRLFTAKVIAINGLYVIYEIIGEL